jgi:hypothetical protein
MSYFSSEAMISMANGVSKNINLIIPGDYILNKLNQVVKVKTISNVNFTSANAVQLDNSTPLFYTLPTVKFLKHQIHQNNSHSSDYDTILNIHTEDSKLKKNMKIFAYDSDVAITSYNNTPVTKTLYTFSTVDSVPTFFVNDVIVKIM